MGVCGSTDFNYDLGSIIFWDNLANDVRIKLVKN